MTTITKNQPPTRKDMVTIQGIIVPCAWDENGAIRGVTIDTFDERSFQVADQGPGEALKGFTRRRIEAWGFFDKNQEVPVLNLGGYRFLASGDNG